MSLNTNQLDLFNDAPYSPMLPTMGNVTNRPVKRMKPANKLATRSAKIIATKMKAVSGSSDLIQNTIENNAQILKNLGCEYVIMTKEGRVLEHGALADNLKQQATPTHIKIKKSKRSPAGTFSHHYKPFIENLQPGEVVLIPFKTSTGVNLPVSNLNSAVTAWLAANWGKDASTTHVNRKLKGLEVLRLK